MWEVNRRAELSDLIRLPCTIGFPGIVLSNDSGNYTFLKHLGSGWNKIAWGSCVVGSNCLSGIILPFLLLVDIYILD